MEELASASVHALFLMHCWHCVAQHVFFSSIMEMEMFVCVKA